MKHVAIVPQMRRVTGILKMLTIGLLWSSNVLLGTVISSAGSTSVIGTAEAGNTVIVPFTIRCTTNAQVVEQFPLKAPLHAVKTIALAIAPGGSPSDADLCGIRDMNGQQLNESLSLEDYGITDNTRLLIQYK